MTEIEIAERTLATLQDKKDRAQQRNAEIAEQRKHLGYDAHANADAKARKQLDALNMEAQP